MRILQLIDSLDAGGAERMAVNYANGLAARVSFSALVVSRKEGPLRGEVGRGVSYLFLNRKSTYDLAALRKLVNFIKQNKVQIVHAHSTSFLLAVMARIFSPSVKLIWHDHYGNSEFVDKRPARTLRALSAFFWGTIVVNKNLLEWGLRNLQNKNIIYLPNFVSPPPDNPSPAATVLQGVQGKRIICLANLRKQKGHFFLVDVAADVVKKYPEWTFHLVGKDFQDCYSEEIRKSITQFGLTNHVFLYGSRPDIANPLRQSDIAILTSLSEGLPVALLEYGLHGLPVVVTSVGEIPAILDPDHGIIVASGDQAAFAEGLKILIDDAGTRKKYGDSLSSLIYSTFVEEVVLKQYLNWIKGSDKWS